MNIYLIGSLRNPRIPAIAGRLERAGHTVFSDWFAAGKDADDNWRDYERAMGHSYIEALQGKAATHVFEFDLHHLQACEAGVLVCPAGKSAFLELGYLLGRGTPGYILLDNPDRWDVMLRFATGVYTSIESLIGGLHGRGR